MAPEVGPTVGSRLAAVATRIRAAERRAGRSEGAVTLVAISKNHGLDVVEQVLDEGQRVFGENRVQEAASKWAGLRGEISDIELHLIGRLQSNKARAAVDLFDVIQSVDRPELAAALGREMARGARRPRCLVQVNTGREPQKGGVLPESADWLIDECIDRHALPVVGVMCFPPALADPEPHFILLREIAERNGLAVVSMGMSADFERAIECGATHVRVGSAIFGARIP